MNVDPGVLRVTAGGKRVEIISISSSLSLSGTKSNLGLGFTSYAIVPSDAPSALPTVHLSELLLYVL